MKLLRTFPKVSFEFGLASWQWLGLREQTPRFATCFGDIFLESLDGWWFLDTVEGTLELRWTSAVTMYAELESAEGRATYLMDDLVRDARSRGIHLGEEDIYVFNPHPALGGELGVNSLGTMRFELAVNWVGQMHDQVLHSSGEINVPPMPDGGRPAPARQVATAWDAAWSEESKDETFDVPFEQYLATTTFAAVAAPKQHNDGGYLPPPPLSTSEPRHTLGSPQGLDPQRYDAPRHKAQGYEAQGYEAPVEPARAASAPPVPAAPVATPPVAAPPWPGQDGSASPWSGQTEAAPWQAPSQLPGTATPPEGYDAPYDLVYPAPPEQQPTGVAGQQPGAPFAQRDWPAASTAANRADQDEHNQTGPAWGNPAWSSPTWGNPSWGGQAPTVAAGGSPQASGADDPFTAWDDLWGKR